MEIEEIYEKWRNALNLHKLDEDVGYNTAALLQNAQLLIGESKSPSEWKRLVMPFIRRVFPNLIINKIGSVQPSLYQKGNKVHNFKKFEKNQLQEQTCVLLKRRLPVKYAYKEVMANHNNQTNLDAEFEFLSVLAQEMVLAINRIHLSLILKSSGYEYTCDKASLLKMLPEYFQFVKDGSNREFPNFIICNDQHLDALNIPKSPGKLVEDYVFNLELDGHTVKIYRSSWIPKMILGFKGDHACDAGIASVMMDFSSLTPIVLDPDSFNDFRNFYYEAYDTVTHPEYFATIEVIDNMDMIHSEHD